MPARPRKPRDKAKVEVGVQIAQRWILARLRNETFYSLDGELVEARITTSTVELLHRGRRLISYVRSYVRGKHTTTREHMPLAHQKHVEWTPSRIIEWAGQTGPKTADASADAPAWG